MKLFSFRLLERNSFCCSPCVRIFRGAWGREIQGKRGPKVGERSWDLSWKKSQEPKASQQRITREQTAPLREASSRETFWSGEM